MRAYFFQNFYLQGIHAGIQSQHTTAEMFVKYGIGSDQHNMLFDWAINHKTTIVLNGGMQSDLLQIEDLLEYSKFPWASFREEQNALNGALTNVGVILPEYVYNAPKYTDRYNEFYAHFADTELLYYDLEFVKLLQTKRLMT